MKFGMTGALGAAVALALAGAAQAAVIVLGNYKTGQVVVQSDVERAVALAKGGTDAGWTQIFGPDDDRPGWGMVLCVRHAKGVFFAEANGAASEAEARSIVELKADRFLARLVGGDDAGQIERKSSWPDLARQAAASGTGAKVECAPPWNNHGQTIDFVGKPLDVSDPEPAPEPETQPPGEADSPAQPAAATESPEPPAAADPSASAPAPARRDFEAEYQAKMRVYEQQLAEQQRQVEAFEAARLEVERRKAEQAEAARAAVADHERQLEARNESVAASARDYADRESRYAEQVRQWRGGSERLADFPEALSVCVFDTDDLQSKMRNWTCVGPLQFNYAKLDGSAGEGASPGAISAVASTCGGKPEDVRDLGMSGPYRVFGCSFGINPDPKVRRSLDAARRFGLDHVDGRLLFRCPASKSSCRTRL